MRLLIVFILTLLPNASFAQEAILQFCHRAAQIGTSSDSTGNKKIVTLYCEWLVVGGHTDNNILDLNFATGYTIDGPVNHAVYAFNFERSDNSGKVSSITVVERQNTRTKVAFDPIPDPEFRITGVIAYAMVP